MEQFDPKFEVTAMGHVTARFLGNKDSATVARLVEWLRQKRWIGCLQVNFTGNGGLTDIAFAEKPKRLVETNGETNS